MFYLSELNTTMAEPSELTLFSDPPNQVAVHKIYFQETRLGYNTSRIFHSWK